MKSKFYTGIVLFITGLFLLAGALALTMKNTGEERRAGEKSRQTVETLFKEITENDTEEKDQDRSDALDIDGSRYIGIITIPKLSLELPVSEQLSSAGLKMSPCRYSGSVEKGNLVIAAHNYQTHFGDIYTLEIGDEVYFTEINGTTRIYEVAEIEILKPYETERMIKSEFDMTLFTCTVGGRSRVTVRCEKTVQ